MSIQTKLYQSALNENKKIILNYIRNNYKLVKELRTVNVLKDITIITIYHVGEDFISRFILTLTTENQIINCRCTTSLEPFQLGDSITIKLSNSEVEEFKDFINVLVFENAFS